MDIINKHIQRIFLFVLRLFVNDKCIALSLLLFLCANLSFPVVVHSENNKIHKIHAAFIYRFLLFTEWPETVYAGDDQKIVIGILGHNPFGDLFKHVEGTPVNGRSLEIRQFSTDAPFEELQQCQLLFICSSLKDQLPETIDLLKDLPVLTVSDIEGFAEAGGIIGFYLEGSGVKFVVNRAAAKKAGIMFRSQLLRVAPRIIE